MWATIEQLLKDNPDLADSGQPQSEQSVDEAERALGVVFPTSFRQYLCRWGWVSFGPNQYQGLGTTVYNVVLTTQSIRDIRRLPAHLVVVCDHDGDEYVCLDTRTMNGNECKVLIWDSPTQSVSRPRAETFAEFLQSDIEDFLTEE